MPAIPTPCITADIVIKTMWAYRRSRLYYQPTLMPSHEGDLTAVANKLMAVWGPLVAKLVPAHLHVQRVECRYYGAGGAGFFANSSSAAIAGDVDSPIENTPSGDPESDSEDVMPDEACVIIQRKTGQVGRSKQGRLFITGLSERVNFAGEVSSNYRAEAQALANQLPVDVDGVAGEYTPVLHARHWDRKNNLLLPVTKAYVVNAIGTRKDRRKPVPYERI